MVKVGEGLRVHVDLTLFYKRGLKEILRQFVVAFRYFTNNKSEDLDTHTNPKKNKPNEEKEDLG